MLRPPAVRFGLAADPIRPSRRAHGGERAFFDSSSSWCSGKSRAASRWAPWQRFTIALAARVAPAWREATLLVQRRLFSAGIGPDSAPSGGGALGHRDGRPPRAALIREMGGAQSALGPPSGIHGELLKLGVRVCKRTVGWQRKRVMFTGSQRLTIALLTRWTASWRATVTLVQPATVLRCTEKASAFCGDGGHELAAESRQAMRR